MTSLQEIFQNIMDAPSLDIDAQCLIIYRSSVGKRVRKCKISGKPKLSNLKPFKSGELVNTVKGVIIHPQLRVPAYTFEEDDSYVECRRCEFVE